MIFGSGVPVIYNASFGPCEFKLKFSNIFPNWQQKEEIEHTSVINGKRFYNNRWTHYEFKIVVNLFLVTGAGEPAPWDTIENYINELFKMNIYDVKLRPHEFDQNGSLINTWLKAEDGSDLTFHAKTLKPFYVKNIYKADAMEILLRSVKPVEVGQILVEGI